MTRHKLLVSFLVCLSASLALRAQNYSLPDEVNRFDASAVYCVDVQNAAGRSISNQLADAGAIGAFVGTELRGVSQLWPSLSQEGKTVLLIRVWGNDVDPSTVTFRTRNNNIEYQIGTQSFDGGREVTYGSPSAPVVFTFEPLTGLRLEPTNVLVTLGSTAQATPVLLPENHSTVLSNITYQYGSSAPEVFTVDDSGVISGLALGNGYLSARAMLGDNELFSAMATVSVVKQYVPVTSIRNNMPSTEINVYVGGDFQLDFTVLPEDATIQTVSYTIADEDMVGYNEYEPGKFNFQAFSTGQTTITVTSDDNRDISLTYTIKVEEPPLEWVSFKQPSLRLMVGNDVTPFLSELLYWGPADKPLPAMTYEVVSGDAIVKNGEGHIVAVKTGTATLRASVTGLSTVNTEIPVEVVHPATDIIVKKDTLRLLFDDPNGMMKDISDDIKNNVAFTPTDYESFGDETLGIIGCPSFGVTGGYDLNISTTPDPDHPRDYMLDAKLWGGGTYTVTVQLAVPDYIAMAANGGGWADPIVVEKSFVVVVTSIVTRIELPEDLYVDNGQKLDLTKVLTLYPEDHLPFDYSTLHWNINYGDDEYITIKDNILTAVQPTFGRSIYLSVDVEGTMMSASTNVYITNPCTAIKIKPGMETIEAEYGKYKELTAAINEAFIFEPADHDNEVEWTVSNPAVVDHYYTGDFWPVNRGEATITASIYGLNDKGERVVRLSASVKVVVTKPIETVLFKRTSIHLAVGDDITDVLPQMIEITPEDPDDARMTYTVISGTALTKRDDGHIVATALGKATIQVQSVAVPSLTSTLQVEVVNPATGIVIKKDELEFEFSGTGPDAGELIAKGIKENISFTPADFQFFGDPDMTSLANYPDISSSNDAVLNISCGESLESNPRDYQLDAMPWNGGVVTITVRLYVPDYVAAAASLTGDAEPRIVEKSFKVTLVMDASNIYMPDLIRVEEGEKIDLRDYVEPYPEGSRLDKDKLVFETTSESDTEYVKIEGYILTALKPYKSGAYIKASHEKVEMPTSTTVVVTRTAKSMKVKSGYEVIVVDKGDDSTLQKMLDDALEILPEGHTDDVFWASTNETAVEPIRNFSGNYTFKTHDVGVADLTATIYSYDDNGEADMNSPRLQVQLRVKVILPLVEIAINAPETMMVGVPTNITITPNKGSTVEPTLAKFTETGGYRWPIFSYDQKIENNDGTMTLVVTPLVPATTTLQLSYESLKAETKSITVSLPTPLSKGWQWMTLWGSNVKDNPDEVFGNSADEIRSQTALLSRDDTEGWFGTLELAPATAYMVKANADVAADKSFLQSKGNMVTMRQNISLYKGWTWLAYPYVNSFTPDELKLTPTAGDRIVSKDDGFVEYSDGKWTGTLTKLSSSHAYLYYSNASQAATLSWQPESSLYTAAHPAVREVFLADIATDDESAAARQTDNDSSHWTYDHSTYRNNMTMVARIDADGQNVLTAADASRYTIGAFVGSECRGEGRPIDGLMFITVHANQGELVSFRLYDSESDFEFAVNEQVIAAMMLGNISLPYRLTFDQTQGVEAVHSSQFTVNSYYDPLGRKHPTPNTQHPTLLIERQANGKYKKIVVR